jgi:ABC-2 type transport system permease protein
MGPASALWFKRRCEWRNGRRLVRAQPALKRTVVAVAAVCFEAGLLALFADAFRFLNTFDGAGSLIVPRLFSLFFMGLGAMITLSGLVTAYTTLFRSAETPWLLTSPFTERQIVLHKHIESSILASWAFVAVMLPFMLAYAWNQRLSPAVALWTVCFSVPFLLVCTGLGTIAVLILARWIGGAHRILIGSGVGALVIAWAWWTYAGPSNPEELERFSISRLVPGLLLASNPLLPSWWMAEGITALSRHEWLRGGLLLALLTTTAVTVGIVVEFVGSMVYYEAWQRAMASQARTRRAARLFDSIHRALCFLPADIRAMAVKDIRVFLRDPAQWAQVLVFFGLLGLFFNSLTPERYAFLPDAFQPMVAFLNVFSVSAVTCSIGSRFVYPQLSLEGQAFWVLGLSPTSPARLIVAKFAMSATAMVAVSAGLVAVSSVRLGVPADVLALTVTLMAALALGTCALSVGLGAVFLDLRQSNPAAIVSGFGGTLNLVLGLALMLAVLLPFALLYHLKATGALPPAIALKWQAAAWVWLAGVTALATIAPLAIGARSLRQRDY